MARVTPGAVLAIIILLFIIINPGSEPSGLPGEEQLDVVVKREVTHLGVLKNSSYGDLNSTQQPQEYHGLNLTGFRLRDNYKWDLLAKVQERARTLAAHATGHHASYFHDNTANSSLLLYQNTTGWTLGRWVRSKIPEEVYPFNVNLSVVAPDIRYPSLSWSRNITGKEGKAQIRFDESPKKRQIIRDGSLQETSAKITIQDETSYADGWDSQMYGVHYLNSGAIILTTTSEKFDGIFGLPHFTFSANAFNDTRDLLLKSLNETIRNQESKPEESLPNPWTSTVSEREQLPGNPNCDLIAYVQQHPISSIHFDPDIKTLEEKQAALLEMENELRYPTGAKEPRAPQLKMSMIVFSPDCGFVIESKGPPDYIPQTGDHLQGPKIEIDSRNTKTAILVLVLISVGQVSLLLVQVKDASTPSKQSRISSYTIAIQSLGSGFIAFIFQFHASIVDDILLLSLAVAFFAFLDGLFFSMKLMMQIWSTQEPERIEQERQRERERIRNTNTSSQDSSNDETPSQTNQSPDQPSNHADTLPAPVTASQPTGSVSVPTPIIIPPDQDSPADTATANPIAATNTNNDDPNRQIYTRYILTLLTLVFVSIWSASSFPLLLRSIYTNTITFIYLSMWIPQIYRNIIRKCRKPLLHRFIIGQSLLRFLPIAYFWGWEDNILFVDTDRRMLSVLAIWMWTQICILVAQEILGPRFLVKESWSWVPVGWEWHPVLREDEEGATMPVGFSNDPTSPVQRKSSISGSGGKTSLDIEPSKTVRKDNQKIFDCAICMQTLSVDIVPSGSQSQPQSQSPPSSNSTVDDKPSNTNFFSGKSMNMSIGFSLSKRQNYMVTPCRHIFHTECLEGWMGVRLVCPICRENLPPL